MQISTNIFTFIYSVYQILLSAVVSIWLSCLFAHTNNYNIAVWSSLRTFDRFIQSWKISYRPKTLLICVVLLIQSVSMNFIVTILTSLTEKVTATSVEWTGTISTADGADGQPLIQTRYSNLSAIQQSSLNLELCNHLINCTMLQPQPSQIVQAPSPINYQGRLNHSEIVAALFSSSAGSLMSSYLDITYGKNVYNNMFYQPNYTSGWMATNLLDMASSAKLIVKLINGALMSVIYLPSNSEPIVSIWENIPSASSMTTTINSIILNDKLVIVGETKEIRYITLTNTTMAALYGAAIDLAGWTPSNTTLLTNCLSSRMCRIIEFTESDVSSTALSILFGVNGLVGQAALVNRTRVFSGVVLPDDYGIPNKDYYTSSLIQEKDVTIQHWIPIISSQVTNVTTDKITNDYVTYYETLSPEVPDLSNIDRLITMLGSYQFINSTSNISANVATLSYYSAGILKWDAILLFIITTILLVLGIAIRHKYVLKHYYTPISVIIPATQASDDSTLSKNDYTYEWWLEKDDDSLHFKPKVTLRPEEKPDKSNVPGWSTSSQSNGFYPRFL